MRKGIFFFTYRTGQQSFLKKEMVRWGQKQHMDYHILFDKYDAYVEQNRTSTEKLKLRSQYKQFQNTLKKLLSYAVA